MAIHYITENNDLQKLTSDLHQTKEFAIDLEFDRNRYRYGFNMCLMQIYDGNDCYLVDPLSDDLDIKTIFPVIQNPEVQKVVFAFGEDLRLLHSLGCFPKNLYDLDAATSLLNYEPASLTNLIKEVLDVKVNSSSQQSNWWKRPLSENQKQYAADDVIYLLDFKAKLNQQAEKRGILDWIKQENDVFDHLDYSDEDHNNLIKEKDKNNLSVFEWFVYCQLMDFFDEKARELNKPMYQLASKKIVSELAQNPDKVHNWKQTMGIYGRIKNDNFKSQLQSVVDSAIHEAKEQDLSTSRKASDTMTGEEYRAMRNEQNRINDLRNRLLSPIQDRLVTDFGKHAKSFILPNRLTKEIIAGETELMPDYKVKLLRRYAEELDLDLSDYV
ncbi:MAG: ribonuclease D [Gracilimonas sp.]|uniref:ribonuclease D n=1 Tax=Gracilimonas sp. TaxID=1974203 RepID=UPI001B0FF0A7|nr:ribonuclease D [Gracilimonas sp.]MBO6587045.1 ribonuclease D [Gracilimonas sp.]MBO6614467.1 ribonuclease D [Gracilimonas sp.]